jgi:hypothetical protein
MQACFMLASVHTPSSPVREREREIKKEKEREKERVFIFKMNDVCLDTF